MDYRLNVTICQTWVLFTHECSDFLTFFLSFTTILFIQFLSYHVSIILVSCDEKRFSDDKALSSLENSGHQEILLDIVAEGLTRPLVQFSSGNIQSNDTEILKNRLG